MTGGGTQKELATGPSSPAPTMGSDKTGWDDIELKELRESASSSISGC